MVRLVVFGVVGGLVLGVTGCAAGEQTGAQRWTRHELYFGGLVERSAGDVTPITAAEWDGFLDAEVTPRFPDGLTVLDAVGRYRTDDGHLIRDEPTKLLIVFTPPAAGSDAAQAVRAVARAYVAAFGQESVLYASSEAEVNFVGSDEQSTGQGG